MKKDRRNARKQRGMPLSISGRRVIGPALLLLCLAVVGVGFAASPTGSVKVAASNNQRVQDSNDQSGALGSDSINESALQQIQALEDEKASRTPAQQKISSRLLYASRMQRGQAIAAGIQRMDVGVTADDAGRVAVDISAEVDNALLNTLEGMGVQIVRTYPQYHRISAKAPLDQLETIAGLSQVHFIGQKPQVKTHQVSPTDVASAPSGTTSFQQRVETLRRAFEANGIGVVRPNLIPNGYVGVGSANAEGVISHGVYSARGTFNTDGTGIRIGVLSDGADSVAASQATGDLPPTCSSPVLPPANEHCVNVVDNVNGGDEGTAMMEVIHDLAPGAQLYFATAFTSPESFAQNIDDLRNVYACDIIVDDVGYSNESPFQDGQGPLVVSPSDGQIIGQAVNDVTASGALYFSSASNSGNKNDGTSGTWEGDFLSGGASAAPLPLTGNLHQFTAGQNFDRLTSASDVVDLYWADPLGSSANDYDLFVLNSAGTTVLTASTDTQNGVASDPYEECFRGTAYPTNSRIVILQKTGAANRFMHLDTFGATLTINTQGSTHGHNAVTGAYGVAATEVYAPFNFAPTDLPGPYPGLFTGTSQVEKFSSDGPRRYFFNADSTPVTPGNFSSTGGIVLQQPVLTASDGQEVTGVGGFPNPFYGTSCSAPTAAAIAGLIKSANPSVTQAAIKTALTNPNIDIEAVGTDRDAGFGIVMAYASMQTLALPGKAFIEFNGATATETCCNANGIIEPGEGATLSINLKNTGLLNATGITTTLTTSTPSVTIFNNASAYTNLTSGGGAASNTTNYTFKLQGTPPEVDRIVNFTLTINYTNGWTPSQVINFTVPLGRQTITTTLDTTAPTTSLSFPTTATGNQTQRISRADPPSSCAVPKSFPGAAGSGNRRYDSYTLTNPSASPVCVTVTLTPDKSATDFIQSVAYLGSFVPATVSTNYLADTGVSSIPGYPKAMSFTVPAGGTVVIVVNETTAAGSGTNTPYTLDVDGLPLTAAPTAATTGISGEVRTAEGEGVGGVSVILSGTTSGRVVTDATGHYFFDNLAAGGFYTVTPEMVNYSFGPTSRSISLAGNLTDATFVATPNSVATQNPIDSADYFVRQ
ncbi:MAG TPA: S8 family serine peptidase, partial [Pyrinomonadaceae bacterium]|nr:S8 family serine peptidase [Pyrinomonadaceae bacterium]